MELPKDREIEINRSDICVKNKSRLLAAPTEQNNIFEYD